MACEVGCEKFVRINKGVVIHEADVIVLVCECPLANRFDLVRVRGVLVAARQEHFVCERFTHDVEIRIDSTLRIRAEPGAVEELVVNARRQFREPRFTLGGDSLRLVCVTKATLIQPVDSLIVDEIIETMASLHCDKNLHFSSRKVKGLAQRLAAEQAQTRACASFEAGRRSSRPFLVRCLTVLTSESY